MHSPDDASALAQLDKAVEAERTKVEAAVASHRTETVKHETALGSLQQAKATFEADPSDTNADAVVKATAETSKAELFITRTRKLLDDARADLAKAERNRNERELEMVAAKCDQQANFRELETLVTAKATSILGSALALHDAAKQLADNAQAARRRKLELQKALNLPTERTEAEIRAEARSASAVDYLPRVLRDHIEGKGLDRTKVRWLQFI
jgi:hypothetical protein